jgi:hypothetical protein
MSMPKHTKSYSKPPEAVAAHQGVRDAKYLTSALLLDSSAPALSPADIIERLFIGKETRASVAERFLGFSAEKQMQFARALRDEERCSNELLAAIAATIRTQVNGSKPAPSALALLSVEARAEEIAVRASDRENLSVAEVLGGLPKEYLSPPLSLKLADAFDVVAEVCDPDVPAERTKKNILELVAKRLRASEGS